MQHREQYDSDVSDREWTTIRQYLPRGAGWVRRHVMSGGRFSTRSCMSQRRVAPGDTCRMIFLDGAWSIVTLPVGRGWEFGSALTMPFGKRGVRKALKKPRARPASTLRALKWLTGQENAAL